MDPLQTTIYNSFDRGLYRIGVPVYQNSSGNSISASGLSVGGDSSNGSIDPSEIASGGAADIQMQYVGAIASGKTQFNNTENGWILGVDKGTPKFYIGNATNYLNWDGNSLIISGNISATTGTIGGFTIGVTDLSATGLDINSSTPKIVIGTGANAITLDGSNGTISGSGFSINGSSVLTVTYKNGLQSRAGTTASGTLVFAHGLPKAPTSVFINSTWNPSANATSMSNGFWNGSTTSTNYNIIGGTGINSNGNSSSAIVFITDGTNSQTAVITADATNITLTFTKTGSPTNGNILIAWGAQV